MSQEQVNQQEQEIEAAREALLEARQLDLDWALQDLLQMANTLNASIGITLTVGGTLLTGQLIGGAEYWKKFADQFASAFPPGEATESIRESFAAKAEIYPAGAPMPKYGYNYIHIDNCRAFVGGSFVPTTGTLWRGRAAEVDGFSLGVLNAN